MPSVFSTLPLTEQALPRNRASDFGLCETGESAWRLIIAAEDDALLQPHAEAKKSDPLVGIRLLGFLLLRVAEQRHRSPFSTGYRWLLLEIISGNRYLHDQSKGEKRTPAQRLQQLGLDYRGVMFRTCLFIPFFFPLNFTYLPYIKSDQIPALSKLPPTTQRDHRLTS